MVCNDQDRAMSFMAGSSILTCCPPYFRAVIMVHRRVCHTARDEHGRNLEDVTLLGSPPKAMVWDLDTTLSLPVTLMEYASQALKV